MCRHAGLIMLALVCQSALAAEKAPSFATDKGSVLLAAMVSPSWFRPSIRVFTANNFALGGGFGVNSRTVADQSEAAVNTLALSLAPEATYFFGGPGSTLLPYVDGGVTLSASTEPGGVSDYVSVDAGVRLAVGLCPLIGTHGAMMAEVGYSCGAYNVKYGSATGEEASESSSGEVYLAAGFGGFIF